MRIKWERTGVGAISLGWIVIGVSTWGLEVEPLWSKQIIGLWFVLAGILTAVVAVKPTAMRAAFLAGTFSTAAALARAAAIPFWYAERENAIFVIGAGVSVYLMIAIFNASFWLNSVPILRAKYKGFTERRRLLEKEGMRDD